MNPQTLSLALPRKVRVLDPHVAEKIAAGEVVERPASVVKELLENSLDAGATEILIVLEDGGKASIEILDNGHGMSREDLALCTERHATSKISSLEDLDRIATLGFRGEALPSIAAVSDLSITTRDAESAKLDSGTALLWARRSSSTASEITRETFGSFLGKPHGTRVLVRSLFAEIPARLKFLKSQAGEVTQVREWVERLSLTHPETGFRLVSGDRTILDLRPSSEAERVASVLSDDPSLQVESAEIFEEGVQLRMHWLRGLSLSQSRRMVQVVNGRALKDRMLSQAVLSAFKQSLLPGQFPAVGVFVQVDPATIDVNVHPTKTEVRFLNSAKIFRAIHHGLERLVLERGMTPSPGAMARAGVAAGYALPKTEFTAAEPHAQLSLGESKESEERGSDEEQPAVASSIPPAPAPNLDATPDSSASSILKTGNFAGILFQTYVLWDLGQEVALIDQHAAHERIRYESLKRALLLTSPESAGALAPQQLLLPEQVAMGTLSEDPARQVAAISLMGRLGFDTEPLSQKALIVRSVPALWGTEALRTRLQTLVANLAEMETEDLLAGTKSLESKGMLLDESLFEKLASQACRSSIRAGDRIEASHVQALVQKLFECEHPWNCPHGRPTIVRIPRARFEEWFSRRV